MKLSIISSGFLLFVIGFIAGRSYENMNHTSITATTEANDSVIQVKSTNPPQKPDFYLAKDTSSSMTDFKKIATNYDIKQKNPAKSLLPHEIASNADLQAQFLAQRLESMRTHIEQMDEMIQSLEENRLPPEDIKMFQEIKKAKEQELASMSRTLEEPPTNRTESELEKDFAASLEAAGMPVEERNKIMDNYATHADSIQSPVDLKNVPPHEQHE